MFLKYVLQLFILFSLSTLHNIAISSHKENVCALSFLLSICWFYPDKWCKPFGLTTNDTDSFYPLCVAS